MKTILVTGGAGFIGSNFIRHTLSEGGCKVVNLDALTYAGNLENLRGVQDHPDYTFVRGDIADRPAVKAIFASHRIDAVVNFAAESHVDRSIENPAVFLTTNVMGTQVLLDMARASWETDPGQYREGVRFLQVSTDEVYGALGPEGEFTEASPLAPNSPYAASKAAADLMAAAYLKTYGLPVLITRCSNNYGPRQYPEKLIPLMIRCAMADEPLPVYGDGMQVRDWLHVDDHCRAISQVLQRGRVGEVYNIGGNNEQYNIDMVRAILRILQKPDSLIHHVKDRLGHDRRYAVNSEKLSRELGWSPKVPFEEGFEETVKWYAEQ